MEELRQQTDETIWRLCLKGDRKAFKELYNRYYPLLFNYGCKFSSNREMVRDCVQNLFIKLIQRHQSLCETQVVKGYLLKAFRNHLYDSIKQENARNALFPSYSDMAFTVGAENDFSSGEQDVSDSIIIMRLAFLELTTRQQEILYLYYVLESSHADISSILNINYQSSKNLLFRSILKLRECFFQKSKEFKVNKSDIADEYSADSISDNPNWFYLWSAK